VIEHEFGFALATGPGTGINDFSGAKSVDKPKFDGDPVSHPAILCNSTAVDFCGDDMKYHNGL